MAFKLTYSDGQESDYDDDTLWEVDNGVLKLGRTEGKWSVLLSPSHWAVVEIGGTTSSDDDNEDDSDSKDDDTKDASEEKDDGNKDDSNKDD